MFAVRMRLGQSLSGPASTCIEDPRVRTSSVAARSARPPRSYRVRHRRLELWTPPQERRGLCQAPDTRIWLNQRSKSRRRDFVCFRPQAPRWKGRVSSFPTHHPARSESNHEAVRTPDLESRSTTLFLGRACRTRFSRASTEGTQFRRSHKKNAEKGTVGGRKIQERGCEDTRHGES